MSKNLIIVESPAKAKTIQKFIGKDFTVISSKGHVRDLPQKDLGIDVDKSFEPKSPSTTCQPSWMATYRTASTTSSWPRTPRNSKRPNFNSPTNK